MSRSRKFALAAAALAATLLGLSMADPRGLRRQMKLREETAALQQKSSELAAENAALRREISALSGDMKALERAAREDLGLIKPQEVIFNFDR